MGKQGQAARSTKQSAIDAYVHFLVIIMYLILKLSHNSIFATKNLHRQSNLSTRSLKGCWLIYGKSIPDRGCPLHHVLP